jgi:hypothetical protein
VGLDPGNVPPLLPHSSRCSLQPWPEWGLYLERLLNLFLDCSVVAIQGHRALPLRISTNPPPFVHDFGSQTSNPNQPNDLSTLAAN